MKNTTFQTLIIKQLSGDISTEELNALRAWKEKSPENQRLADEFATIWQHSGGYQKTFDPDLNAAFEKVRKQISTEAQPQGLKVLSIGQKLLRLAAAVALLTIAVWGAVQLSSTGSEFATVQATGLQTIQLSDGTQVWLREGSSLEHAISYEGKHQRQVRLKGEAYFKVAHDPSRPFQVSLPDHSTVEVLGTEFSVRSEEAQTVVLVRSGKVRFSPDGQAQSPVLTANQKAVFHTTNRQLKISNVQSLNELSWQTGGLEFINTPLKQVVADLETYYQVKIRLVNEQMAGCPHSAPLTQAPISEVLEAIALTHSLKVKETGNKNYELTGGVCAQ
ncbi:MAG: FecR domain-containing protein [Saprospiraceae bacterium]|nr:FecR domain-containing protein [Saprospiraceae bacterium]